MKSLLRRWSRGLRRAFGAPPVPFYYSDEYGFSLPATPLDPLRGEKILAALALAGLVEPGDVRVPHPVSAKLLLEVHTPEYLEALQEAGALARVTGLKLDDHQRERALRAQRAMAGGTVQAARWALRHSGVAVNLGGGLHHAHADHGAGFCIFNDVALAVRRVRRDGFEGPVMVIDLDLHDGDGVRALFRHDPTVWTYSIHNRHWDDPEATAATCLELGSDIGDAAYLEAIQGTLPALMASHRPQLVVYLAGTDPAADDRLGDWEISAAALVERDRRVLQLCRPEAPDLSAHRDRTAVVILLAGGYGDRSWRHSARSLSWLLNRGITLEPPSTEHVLLRRYQALSRLFDPAELSFEKPDDDDWGLTEADLLGVFGPAGGSRTRFLGFYTQHGIELALERNGLLDRLRDKGYADPRVELDLDPASGHTLRVWGEPEHQNLLVELRARRDRRQVPGFEVLFIEWLLLQNPRADFSPSRPPLPGQSHPGLGLLKDAIAMLIVVCERLELDGLAFVPSHYHLAAQSVRYLRFLEPESAARFAAMSEALQSQPLAEATRSVAAQRVIDARTGQPMSWQPAPMALPVSDRFSAHFESPEYQRLQQEAREGLRLELGPNASTLP